MQNQDYVNANPKVWYEKTEIEAIIYNIVIEIYNSYDLYKDNINMEIIKNGIIKFSITKEGTNLIFNINNCYTKLNLINTSFKDTCCVCYDNCNTTLACNHYLCSECMDNIKKTTKDFLCPLCRDSEKYKQGYIFRIPFKAIETLFITNINKSRIYNIDTSLNKNNTDLNNINGVDINELNELSEINRQRKYNLYNILDKFNFKKKINRRCNKYKKMENNLI